jgi:hypothetical protein
LPSALTLVGLMLTDNLIMLFAFLSTTAGGDFTYGFDQFNDKQMDCLLVFLA